MSLCRKLSSKNEVLNKNKPLKMQNAKIIKVLLFQVVSLLVSLHKKDRVRGIYKPIRTKKYL